MHSTVECNHSVLQLEPSPFAELAGFERLDARSRLAATLKSGRAPPQSSSARLEKEAEALSQWFPAPSVLPHDALNYDPEEPPQSLKSWVGEKARNKITDERKTLYVAAAPSVDKKVGFMNGWVRPNVEKTGNEERVKKRVKGPDGDAKVEIKSPDADEITEYLQTFYHGFEVKHFPEPLRWVPWPSTARSNPVTAGITKYVALQRGNTGSATRIRARAPPDGVFAAQLNLDDILDAAIEMLPKDAYALLLLVDHDIYEDEDDDFCCGRAYGGSRVCVVQSARYHPSLDRREGVDRVHGWPMSHCKAYVDELCAVEDVAPQKPTATQLKLSKSGAIRAAVGAASSLQTPSTSSELEALWCSRVARTASHELGHCLGMAHCVYYACNMQSTAGLKEDARQPPYLCPVCLAKLGYGVVHELRKGGEEERERWVRDRYDKIEEFCGKNGRGTVGLWAGLGAWIGNVLDKGSTLA